MYPALIPELGVTDFKTSLHFYCEVIGFGVDYQRPEEGFAMLRLGGAYLMLDQIGLGRTFGLQDGPISQPPGFNIQFEVPALAPIISRLETHGTNWILPPERKWYRRIGEEVGNYQCVFADPDGYRLRPFEPLGSRPAT